MMTSSHDELLRTVPTAAIDIRASAGCPRQARRTRRCHGAGRPWHHHRIARPVGLRQDDADAQHRRYPDRRRRVRSRCSANLRVAAELRHRVGYVTQDADDLPRSAGPRQRALLRRTVRHGRPGRRRGDRRRRAGRSPNGARAATCPAVSAPGSRWPAPWWPTPTCWCSTNRPSDSTRSCGSTCGNGSTHLAGSGTTLLVSSHVMDEADHCGDLLLMRDGRLLAHTTPTRLREDTRMSVTGGSVSVHHPAQHRHAGLSRLSPQAYLATTVPHPAAARRRPPQRRDDPGGTQPDHHADVLHVRRRAASTRARRRRSTTRA